MHIRTPTRLVIAAGMVFLVSVPVAKVHAASEPLVRLAEIEIDPLTVEAYKAALREEISTALQAEPGVLALYAVSVKDHPSQIRLFEMYASPAAYRAHLESTHFKKYKSAPLPRWLNLCA